MELRDNESDGGRFSSEQSSFLGRKKSWEQELSCDMERVRRKTRKERKRDLLIGGVGGTKGIFGGAKWIPKLLGTPLSPSTP